MKVAVVILNWNGVDLLKKFLPTLVQFSPQAELYVIDNASTDASLVFLEKNYPLIHTVPLAENFGFAKGYNEGLQNRHLLFRAGGRGQPADSDNLLI